MRIAIAGIALLFAVGPAAAQTPGAPPEGRAASSLVGRGAEIRIERPDLSLFVRCGDGETAKSCSEIATQLVEKLAAMPPVERRDRRGGERDERRNRDRDRDRE